MLNKFKEKLFNDTGFLALVVALANILVIVLIAEFGIKYADNLFALSIVAVGSLSLAFVNSWLAHKWSRLTFNARWNKE